MRKGIDTLILTQRPSRYIYIPMFILSIHSNVQTNKREQQHHLLRPGTIDIHNTIPTQQYRLPI